MRGYACLQIYVSLKHSKLMVVLRATFLSKGEVSNNAQGCNHRTVLNNM